MSKWIRKKIWKKNGDSVICNGTDAAGHSIKWNVEKQMLGMCEI
jgi:hypothetical protein